jgi:hypothetical protein
VRGLRTAGRYRRAPGRRFLIGAGLTPPQLFLIFAGVALVGMVLTMLVPLRHAEAQPVPVKLSSTPANV